MDIPSDSHPTPPDPAGPGPDATPDAPGESSAPADWRRLADLAGSESKARMARRYLDKSCVPGRDFRRVTRPEGGSQEVWVSPAVAAVVVDRWGADSSPAVQRTATGLPVAAPDLTALVDRLAESERLRGAAEGRVGELVTARDAAVADRDRAQVRAERLEGELREVRRERDALRAQVAGLREAWLRWHAARRWWRPDPPPPAELASDAPRVTG